MQIDLKSPSFYPRGRLSNYQGMSLIEVVVAVGILGILGLVFHTLMLNIQKEYLTVSERITLETEAADLAFYLKHYLSNAVELYDSGTGSVAGNFSNTQGRIREFNLSSLWTVSSGPGVAEPVALFFRETLKSRQTPVPPDAERYLPTGLFLVRPTINRYGVIGFSLGDSTTNVLSGTPGRVSPKFGRLVDLRLQSFVTDGSSGFRKLQSMVVTFTLRAYRGGADQDHTWCPPAQMLTVAVCQTQSPYFDLTKSVEIVLRNNVLGMSTSRRRREKELITDRTLFVPASRRVVDGVYFLVPELPLDSLRR